MKLSDFINLVRRHLILLLVTPVLLAGIVAILTKKLTSQYASETTLYTGIASGSSVEMDKLFNYQASNTAFDNLISIVQSRKTQQEVAIRLLAKHLMLATYDPRYISKKSFDELQRIAPVYIKSMVAESGRQPNASETRVLSSVKDSIHPKLSLHIVKSDETLFSISHQHKISVLEIRMLNSLQSNKIKLGQKLIVGKEPNAKSNVTYKDSAAFPNQIDSTNLFPFSQLNPVNIDSYPESVNQSAYERTVSNLTKLMLQNDTNFVYKLLNYVHPHYSIDAISSIRIWRIANSDLVQLKYETDEPGICQQTLLIFTEVCIKNYKNIKKNRSDDVVRYFDFQLKQAGYQLKVAEDKLLKFNTDNNIINFNEQSKTVALKKEDLDVLYNNNRIRLAGVQAAIQSLEEKLGNQHQILLNNSNIIEKRNQLVDLNYKIASAETVGMGETIDQKKLVDMKARANKLKDDITQAVNQLYSSNNSPDGIPISKLLNDWINNVIEAENIKAGMKVLSQRMKEFQKQYDVYVPAGSNIKKIEREISVSEQQYLDILRSLNLARLKMQDNELASIIKTVDPPYYPLNPVPTKRKLMVIAAAMLGFMIVLVNIFVLEFFDNTLKNPARVSRLLKLPFLAVFPKILLKVKGINYPYITNRMLEIAIQNIELFLKKSHIEKQTKTILIFSTINEEGKTVIAGNLAQKLKMQGEKIFYLNYSLQSLHNSKNSQLGFPDNFVATKVLRTPPEPGKFSIINWLLGYPDTRTDPNSQFLANPANYLPQEEICYYKVNDQFYLAKSYEDILNQNGVKLSYIPDYVLIEIPSILYYPYPVDLIINADIALLVCRSNRVWSSADQGVLNVMMQLAENKTHFILNGAELQVMESVLGDLPKERGIMRQYAKQFFRLQFFSKNKF
ncbi:MAG: LysM peptidoglycan-binding domain-containing protein [Bacteroidia bacterium]|nr:LysM peptidoglycan-binding domain-containing protein [Bacteroidia bacterium]